MKLSKKLNEIYADKRNRHLSLFLKACEKEVVNDEWGRPLSMSHQYLPDQEVLDLVEWWKKKQSEQKYTIQVIYGDYGFLNKCRFDERFRCDSCEETAIFKTHFTKQEIEQFKQLDYLAIDWDKAIIEPVEE